MKIDIPGVNFLICNNWACKYNNPNTRTCSYDARIVLNEDGRCEILPQGNQPKRKRYKIIKKKGSNIPKQENIPPMPKVNQPKLSDGDINKICDLINEAIHKIITTPKLTDEEIEEIKKRIEEDWKKVPLEPLQPVELYYPSYPWNPTYPWNRFWYGNPYEVTCQTSSTYTINSGEENKNDNSKSK